MQRCQDFSLLSEKCSGISDFPLPLPSPHILLLWLLARKWLLHKLYEYEKESLVICLVLNGFGATLNVQKFKVSALTCAKLDIVIASN